MRKHINYLKAQDEYTQIVGQTYFIMKKYNYLKTPIETKRLILVKPSLTYSKRMLEIWKNPKMTKFDEVHKLTIPEAIKKMKERIKRQGKTQISFYALLKDRKYLIGSAGLNISEHNNSAELGYGIDVKYWGKGYCTELVKAVLDFTFTNTDLHRIWATPAVENKASCIVLEKCGFRKEAILRDSAYYYGKYYNEVYYSILKEEYLKKKGKH